VGEARVHRRARSVSEWAAAVKARWVAEVAAALGLTVRAPGQGLGPCPVCQEARRSRSDPRCPLGLTADGLGWHCHHCHAKGDAVTLAALVRLGRVPDNHDVNAWRELESCCEAHGLYTSAPSSAPSSPRPRVSVRRTPPGPAAPSQSPTPAPRRPPGPEVRALWHRCHAVTDDDAVCAWLLEGVKRRIVPALVAERDLARALPLESPLPAWVSTYAPMNGDASHARR
jgi:hypothetical protein